MNIDQARYLTAYNKEKIQSIFPMPTNIRNFSDPQVNIVIIYAEISTCKGNAF